MATEKEADADTLRLEALGYKQEMKRKFSRLTNYGVALSVVSVSSGLSSLFAYGMITGGPVVMVWAWILVSIFTLCVTIGMAEICSAYPTSGGLYYWAGILVPEKYKPVASWFTGWFNLIGQFAVTAAIDFGLSLLIASVISVGVDLQWSPRPFHIVLINLGIVATHGICNSMGSTLLKWLTHISVWWQLLAPIVVSLALLIGMKSDHQNATFVFTQFENYTGWPDKVSFTIERSISILIRISYLYRPMWF